MRPRRGLETEGARRGMAAAADLDNGSIAGLVGLGGELYMGLALG